MILKKSCRRLLVRAAPFFLTDLGLLALLEIYVLLQFVAW